MKRKTNNNSFFGRYILSKMTKNEAESNMKIACIIALLSVAVSVYFALSIPDYWIFTSTFIVLVLALGVYFKDLFSSVLLFVYFLIEKIYQVYTEFSGTEYLAAEYDFNTVSAFVAIFILNAFLLGMLGAIKYRKLVPKKKRKHRYYWLFSFILLILLVFSYIYLLSEQPSDEVMVTDNVKSSVVNIFCPYPGEIFDPYSENMTGGSGVVISEDGIILTNAHIFPQTDEEYLVHDNGCFVAIPDPKTGEMAELYLAMPYVFEGWSELYDVAYMEIYAAYEDEEYIYGDYPKKFANTEDIYACYMGDLNLSDPVVILGYPSLSGGANLTITEGIVSGFYTDELLILTSAQVTPGNSGGMALSKGGCFIGIPSYYFSEEGASLGEIISMDLLDEFADAVELPYSEDL